MVIKNMDSDCSCWIFVYDEPCKTYHLVFDLDQDLLVVHNVSQVGRIKSPDLIQYKRPTSMKGMKYELDDNGWRYVRQLFA
jgi:hypothetical protein